MEAAAWIAALLALVGVVQTLAGWALLRCFRRAVRHGEPEPAGGVTVLKPLHGVEPMLEEALASVCAQECHPLQIVCGVQDPADPALGVVARLQARFPEADIAVVVDETAHGANRKVGNLINMLRVAKHETLVIADSDVWCAPGYLAALAATLARPGVGLATVLYTGRPASPSVAARLGTLWLNHVFLPGALLARALGRQDCLGATMALRRETLEAAGGFAALADEIADDQMLGRHVRALGLEVALARTVVATTVPETTIGALFRHELRWGRTIRALEPVGFALSCLQYPLAWALLGVLLAAGAGWALLLFVFAWAVRVVVARDIDRELAGFEETLATRLPIWLFPLRDLMSMIVVLASHAGTRVEWRGQVLHTSRSFGSPLGQPLAPPHTEAPRDDEDALPAASLLRWIRRRCRVALPG